MSRPGGGGACFDRIVATGCPPIHTYAFDFGPFTLTGSPGEGDETVSYAPRRTVLDKILVDAADEAGAEVREAFTVEGLEFDAGRVVGIRGRGRDGRTVVERASIVVGADGRHSMVAEAVGAEAYDERPPAAGELLRVLERPADGRPVRDLHPARRAPSGRGRPMTS